MDDEEILAEGTRRRVYWTMHLLDLSLNDVEARAGVGRGTLSNFFSGRRGGHEGSRWWLWRIAQALGVNYGWLATGELPDPKRVPPLGELKPVPPLRRGRPPGAERGPGWVVQPRTDAPSWEPRSRNSSQKSKPRAAVKKKRKR